MFYSYAYTCNTSNLRYLSQGRSQTAQPEEGYQAEMEKPSVLFRGSRLIFTQFINGFSSETFPRSRVFRIFSRGNFFRCARVKQSRGNELAGKEVINMNNIKSLMSVVFLTGALGLSAVSAGAESVISKDVLADGSYCHTKFESIREDTLASSQPVLKDADDIVDFYGACNHDP